jgi:hypothetical protein
MLLLDCWWWSWLVLRCCGAGVWGSSSGWRVVGVGSWVVLVYCVWAFDLRREEHGVGAVLLGYKVCW